MSETLDRNSHDYSIIAAKGSGATTAAQGTNAISTEDAWDIASRMNSLFMPEGSKSSSLPPKLQTWDDGRKVFAYDAFRDRYQPQETPNALKRVAAYARVSTDSDEQYTSYEAQSDYYTKYIKGNPAWQFVNLYSDEGVSATSTAKRDGFNRMIEDALAGKIDMIITKSVSRFARNTVDSLVTIRKLKEKGVGCFFEKENIDTLDSKGEVLLTIMSSLAQEESRSISDNVTWGQRKRFSDGKVTMPYGRFLGYDRGPDGKPVINEAEAIVVRRIYKLFLEGKTTCAIAKILTAEHIPTPGGKAVWQRGTISSILTNEKYKGDADLQKSFTTDFLTKKMQPNNGEVPRFYVEDSHPAIVSREVHDLVQYEMLKRKSHPTRQSASTRLMSPCFSNKIVCGDCGCCYGPKTWHSNDKYRKTIWRCMKKYERKDGRICGTRHVTEEELMRAFVIVANQTLAGKDTVIRFLSDEIAKLDNVTEIETKIASVKKEIFFLQQKMQEAITENAKKPLKQDDYNERFQGMEQEIQRQRERQEGFEAERLEALTQADHRKRFLRMIQEREEPLTAFDEGLFQAMVESILVQTDGSLVFRLTDGQEVKI